jgi:hypothetical protein
MAWYRRLGAWGGENAPADAPGVTRAESRRTTGPALHSASAVKTPLPPQWPLGATAWSGRERGEETMVCCPSPIMVWGLQPCLYTKIAEGASQIGFDICSELGYNGRCAPGGH